jgi:hypothetical protein
VVGLDVVLPNGILLPVQCPPSRSLASLKQEVFIRAKRMPLGALLGDSANYVFKAIGLDAIHIEVWNIFISGSILVYVYRMLYLPHL